MRITIDPSHIARMKKAIEDTGRSLRKELVIATNATAKKTQANIAKQLATTLNLKQKTAKRGVKITRTASGEDISATVEVNKDKRFNLTAFNGTKQTPLGVQYKTMRKKNRKIAKGSFEVARWGGRTFKRVGKERGPIRNLRGPSQWGVFVVGKMMQPTVAETEAELKKQIDRRIRFIGLKASGAI